MSFPATDPHLAAVKRLVKVAQDLTRVKRYRDYADLKADLAKSAARLRLRYDAGLIAEALDRFEKGGEALCLEDTAPRRVEELPSEGELVSRERAAEILRELQARIQTMPALRPLTPTERRQRRFQGSKRRALHIVLEELRASLERDTGLAEAVDQPLPEDRT